MAASPSLDERDQRWLRVSLELARKAAAGGDEPYGAVLVDAGGSALLEGRNTIVTDGDPTGHAEINLVRGIGHLDPALLAGATLYASTEPCAMCAGALYWGKVERLVFGLSNARLYRKILSGSREALGLDCRSVLAAGARQVEVCGPLLEDEAAAVVAEWAARRPPQG